GTIGHKYIRCVPDLIVAVQYRSFGIPSHSGRTHLMDALPKPISIIIGGHIIHPNSFQDFFAVLHHINSHFVCILLDFHIHSQYRETPFVLCILVHEDSVFMIEQILTGRAEANSPIARSANSIFPITSSTLLAYPAGPSAPSGGTLI